MSEKSAIRVLVVDDHQQVRIAISALLRRQPGIAVIGEAIDGRQAIEKTRELHPDVILMDIRMPGMDGLETARQLKQFGDCPRILFMTQFDSIEYSNASRQVGGDGFLSKKYLGSNLVDAIRSLAEGGTANFMEP